MGKHSRSCSIDPKIETCIHEAGHAVYGLRDLKQLAALVRVEILYGNRSSRTVFNNLRHEKLVLRRPDYSWRSCALFLAGVAAMSSVFGAKRCLMTYPPSILSRSVDWRLACLYARLIAEISVVDARWGVCPWPEKELAPNDSRFLRTLCGDKTFAKLGKEKQRVIRLAWRRALWVVRRHHRALIIMAMELHERDVLNGKRAARIFNETA